MTGDTVLRALDGVRNRLRRTATVRGAVWGLLAGIVAAATLAVVIAVGRLDLPAWTPALAAVAPVVGAAIGLARRPRSESAAAAIDSHYGLKDRAVSALAFLRRPSAGRWESLQIEDAARHLAGVDPKQVVRFRFTPSLLLGAAATWLYGCTAAGLLLVLFLLGWFAPPLQAAPVGPNPGLVALADVLNEDLDELEKAAEERKDEELKELVKELRERTDALKDEGVELKEALATLSEMQAALKQHAEYNEAVVDAQLSQLAGAMASAEALRPTAEKLEAGDPKAAAEELEKLEKVEPGKRGEKAASDRMKKLSKEMEGKGLGSMGESVSDLAEGLSGGDSGKFCEGCKSLASQLRKHESRKQMSMMLCRQLDKLNECKGQCSMCFGQGQCNGQGQCEGDKNSLAEGFKPKKSDSPSKTFGKSTSGNLFGEKTDLDGRGKQEQLTGEAGEGPSEIETANSPEGREQARRAYKEKYEKYRKLSEEVLDGEPIPLGHRQTIRTYFELIRPQAGDESAQADAAEPAAK